MAPPPILRLKIFRIYFVRKSEKNQVYSVGAKKETFSHLIAADTVNRIWISKQHFEAKY